MRPIYDMHVHASDLEISNMTRLLDSEIRDEIGFIFLFVKKPGMKNLSPHKKNEKALLAHLKEKA